MTQPKRFVGVPANTRDYLNRMQPMSDEEAQDAINPLLPPPVALVAYERTVVFDNEAEKLVLVEVPRNFLHVTAGRIGIDAPGSAFAATLEFTAYRAQAAHGADVLARYVFKMSRTTLTAAALAGDQVLQIADTDDLSQDDLVLLTDGTAREFARLGAVTVTNASTENPLDNGFGSGSAVCRIGEFGDVLWLDEVEDAPYNAIVGLKFASPQTVELVLRFYGI